MTTLQPMRGKWGRPISYGGPHHQRQARYGWVSLADPDEVRAHLAGSRATHLEIYATRQAPRPLKTIPLLELGLGGPADEPDLLDLPDTMQPTAYATPAALARRPAAAPAAPVAAQPAGMDHMTSYVFQQQEVRLLEARDLNQDLRDQLRLANDTIGRQKSELDDVKMELRFKDREHELATATAEARANAEAQPKGLAALPAPMLEGLLGMAAKAFGLGGGAAVATAALEAAPAGTSDGHRQLLAGLAELLPTEELAAKVYAALARLLPTPGGLDQLLALAGLNPSPNPTPQNAA